MLGANVLLQCFDPNTLKTITEQKLSPLPLIQLIGENAWEEVSGVDFEVMLSPPGLDAIAQYADGIGPWIPQLFAANNGPVLDVVVNAHQRGLLVHPYTLRRDLPALPIRSFQSLQHRVLTEAGVDGVFTDFPDLTRAYVDQHWPSASLHSHK